MAASTSIVGPSDDGLQPIVNVVRRMIARMEQIGRDPKLRAAWGGTMGDPNSPLHDLQAAYGSLNSFVTKVEAGVPDSTRKQDMVEPPREDAGQPDPAETTRRLIEARATGFSGGSQ